jgi:phosphoribosyl 1,2-cyclic phosphodiesterase
MSGGGESQFTVLGSGASSGIPWLGCVLADPAAGVTHGTCAVCAHALASPDSPNRRGNVSCALRFARPDGEGLYNVVVDCGKTFRDTLTRVWPRLAPPMRSLQALLLTHPHADAFLGLDCLREASPSTPVHVYCHAPTMRRIEASFPYLVRAAAPAAASSGGGGAGAAAAEPCCAGTEGGGAAAPMPKTYIADLQFHIVTPWVPFVLEGSGGLVVTPIPLEHSGRMGVPHFAEEDTCLGFEFGAFLAQPASTPGPGEGVPPLPPPPPASPAPLALDGRGLPALPPFAGDRVLWVSDVRALSAQVRAFLAARPITLLCLDALGHRSYPTHFSLSQAVACAADLAGPLSATHQARGAACSVLLVGMSHEIDHEAEGGRLAAVAATARVRRPAGGARPLVWEGAAGSSSDVAAEPPFLPLGLASLALARDGTSRPVRITHRLSSLEDLARDVESVRAAASALCSADDFAYLPAATAAEGRMREQSCALEEAFLPASGGPRLALRQREDYWSALPPAYAEGYAGSPSAAVRGAWAFTGRKL